MASITERKKKNGVLTFKFRACLGRDENGQQLFKATTWEPPEGMTQAKARKMAEAEAERWEREVKHQGNAPKGTYTTPPPAPTMPQTPEEETFRYFVEQVWMPLKVVGGGLRPSTVAMYAYILRIILPKLGAKRIKEITGVDIMRYLQYLRDEYRTADGSRLAEKSIKHHFNILRIIFNYAERQDFIEKNPIKKVDPPKLTRHPVEALTPEQAKHFFQAVSMCKLE